MRLAFPVVPVISVWLSIDIVLALSFHSTQQQTKSSTASSSFTKQEQSSPFITAPIDYSAINEYMVAHYGIEDYFPHDHHEEPIWNARLGVVAGTKEVTTTQHSNKQSTNRLTLEEHGLEVASLSSSSSSSATDSDTTNTIDDWSNLNEIEQSYIPQLRELLTHRLEGNIEKIVFWNPRRRGSAMVLDADARTSPVASMVHIDTDVHAYDLADFANLIDKNQLGRETAKSDELWVSAQQIEQWIRDEGRRFCIVNCWRNTIPNVPVQQAPLALYRTLYADPLSPFPAKPDPVQSHWYVVPELSHEEVLLFKQYDRDIRKPSDLWHCALAGYGMDDPETSSRESFDLRAFCVFQESYLSDSSHDRYAQKQRTQMSLEESGTFCDKQDARYGGGVEGTDTE